jgi:hypothetical protein
MPALAIYTVTTDFDGKGIGNNIPTTKKSNIYKVLL